MKRVFSFAFLCVCVICLSTPRSYGQFLKKLKKTVKELVATPPADGSVPPAGSATGKSSNHKKAQNASNNNSDPNALLKDAAAHGIEKLAEIQVDFKNQYICIYYTAIESRQGAIVATIPIGTFTREETLSELGEGSDNDQVEIFENGVQTRQLTAGELKKETGLIQAHKKYDYPWGTELVRNSKKEADQYVKKGAGQGGMYRSIVFKGKNYGPYMIIGDLLVSNDQQRFFAQICPDLKAAESGNYSLLGMDGKIRVLPTGGDLIANLDFTSAAVMIPAAGMKINASMHITSEQEAAALQAEATELMQSAPNKGNVYFLNGKTLEEVLLSDGWLDQSGNNFFATISDKNSGFEKGAYLNGKKIFEEGIKKGQGWSNADGSSWAITYFSFNPGEGNQLIFSDGTKINEARDVHQLFVNGKYYMVWYNYNHKYGDMLRVYKKAL